MTYTVSQSGLENQVNSLAAQVARQIAKGNLDREQDGKTLCVFAGIICVRDNVKYYSVGLIYMPTNVLSIGQFIIGMQHPDEAYVVRIF